MFEYVFTTQGEYKQFNLSAIPGTRLYALGKAIEALQWTSWWRTSIDAKLTSLVLISPTNASLRVPRDLPHLHSLSPANQPSMPGLQSLPVKHPSLLRDTSPMEIQHC